MKLSSLKYVSVYLATALILLGILVISLFLSFSSPNSSPSGPILPTTTPVILVTGVEQSDTYKKSIQKINATEAPFLERSAKVGSLLKELPYQGTNFSMTFDFSTDTFIVTINKSQQAAGTTEFDNFLKQNGVQDKSWISRLSILYQ